MSTTYRSAFLAATTTGPTGLPALEIGEYDIAFFTSGWDRRCLSPTLMTDLSAKVGIVTAFTDVDPMGLGEKHRQTLLDFAKTRCDKVTLVEGLSTDYEGIWHSLHKAIQDSTQPNRTFADVFLDLTPLPLYYSMGLIAYFFRSGSFSGLSALYTEGDYKRADPPVASYYRFTDGKWMTVAVPFLRGRVDSDRRRRIVVSVGFEGTKIMRVLAGEDPDRVSLLLPDPSVNSAYDDIIATEVETIVARYQIPGCECLRIPTGNVAHAWRALEQKASDWQSENIYLLPCGPKTHALALTLFALSKDDPTVLCVIPQKYGFVDIHSRGRYWLTKVSDLSNPISDSRGR